MRRLRTGKDGQKLRFLHDRATSHVATRLVRCRTACIALWQAGEPNTGPKVPKLGVARWGRRCRAFAAAQSDFVSDGCFSGHRKPCATRMIIGRPKF